jgi:histidyl-tRNA synthetase
VFEFTSDALGAQSGVGGGGRYDLLIEQLGGQSTPGIGWAAGIERVLLASEAQETESRPQVYVAHQGDPPTALYIAQQLYRRGLSAQLEQAGRSMKGQMKQADRLGADVVVIVDDGTLAVRDMRTGDQKDARDRDDAIDIAEALV